MRKAICRAPGIGPGVAEEIVVVDCGSRDRTLEIAREYGAKAITNAWTNFAEQKNVAAAAASHDWILSLDADEELSPELRNALLAWKEKEPGFAVYEFARRGLVCWQLDQPLGMVSGSSTAALPARCGAFFRDRPRVHCSSRASPDASTETCSIHDSVLFRTRGEGERYTTLAAQQMYAAENAVGAGNVAGNTLELFNNYVLHLGFLDGSRGWVISRMAARSTRLKFKKLGKLIEAERRAGETKKP